MITLDGVMQAPGDPEEDRSGGFEYGGWSAPYGDKVFSEAIKAEFKPAEYLLGRKTFEIWEQHWPHHPEHWPSINRNRKYVLSNTRTESDWANTQFIKDLEDIKRLKQTDGLDLQVWGSGELSRLLLQHDLVDELRLKIHPLVLGSGKRLFGEGSMPAAFRLLDLESTSTGVILARYERAGDVEIGEVSIMLI